MITSARIAELESQLALAQGQAKQNNTDLIAVRAELATAQENLTALTAERDQLRLDLTALTAERDTLTTTNAGLATQLADVETRIAAEVTKRLGSAGVDPVKRDPKAVDKTGEQTPQGTARERLAASINAELN